MLRLDFDLFGHRKSSQDVSHDMSCYENRPGRATSYKARTTKFHRQSLPDHDRHAQTFSIPFFQNEKHGRARSRVTSLWESLVYVQPRGPNCQSVLAIFLTFDPKERSLSDLCTTGRKGFSVRPVGSPAFIPTYHGPVASKIQDSTRALSERFPWQT